MKKLLMIVAILTLTSCSSPWLSWLRTPTAEHIEEDVAETAAETALELTGTPAHVEIDLDPTTDPHCMHCALHCPKDAIK
jgi:hypothetical protein